MTTVEKYPFIVHAARRGRHHPVKLGFVSEGADAQKNGYLLDTTVAGSSNTGHLFGTELTDEEKWDLIEFLKTF